MNRKKRNEATDERRELKTARGYERSGRKGASVEFVDARVRHGSDEMWTNEKTAGALEEPQGAAVHPAGTPDDLTARHGTRSF